MRITVVCVGKLKEKYLTDACAEYGKRIGRYCDLRVIEVADEKAPQTLSALEEEKIKDEEGKRIIPKIPPQSYAIALAIDGENPDSAALAAKMEKITANGFSEICFIIGGSLGLSGNVLKACHMRLSFSRMTFPHQLMRVVLLEQVYRCFKIINNEPYHK